MPATTGFYPEVKPKDSGAASFSGTFTLEGPPFYAVAGIFTFSALESRIRSFSLELSVGFASSEDGEEHHNSECA